ncbi:PREDICTED: probable serine/threonine-protein kinase drkD [Amphimedon queenslandica]|uniref:Protein kinase domain-containing protein n=1 Tax=Amphimedon queenslandica TaxID=400682 RepID=A0A1X7TY69_AMPQE|nr:PREDICTED: probable serine/threonine-protein kinase drkD [Amphimedon queenslandica]|eukprot:XP_019857155.1 PREDICTED: probable serine/threonine-protein kinase drkD [Amphimedon queenslandica]
MENEMLWEDVEKLRRALKEEAEMKNDAYKKLKEQEEEIEARVNERVQEEVKKNLCDAVKAQLTSQQIDKQRKVFEDHLKEKEEKAKTQYEELLTSKDIHIKELMEQLEQKEKFERNLHDEINSLQLKLKNSEANNKYEVARGKELEEMIGKLEKDKREVERNFEMRLADTMKAADELEHKLRKKVVEIEDLNDVLAEKEKEMTTIAHLASEEKKQTVSQLKEQMDELVKKSNTQEEKIKELVEKIQIKEAENEIYKQDFESERNDKLKATKQLRLQRQNSKAKLHDYEEEIQVLRAQINACSREVDKQKGIVTQSQEKHKTEVNELSEKLANELKSKQQMDNELAIMRQQLDNVSRTNHQLDNELAIMRQQLDNVSADKEELYNKVTGLEDKIESMKQANVVLKDKLLKSQFESNSLQEEVASLQKMLSGFQNSWKLSPKEVSLSKELGRGGYGVVWVGQLRVAVKKLHEWIASQHNMETFHHEINIMSQLRHPNLLQFIGAVLDDPSGCPMIVTEVMDTSLREAYENKELTPDPDCRPVILSIMHDAAQGLKYLHCLPDPIIHRDVSSANVLLQSIAGTRKWKGKISDFGSAKLAENAVTEGPGAFAYSAPEAFQNMANPDPTKKQTTKMDVFSYGILFCEIMTCRFPDRVNFQDMLRQVHSISNRPSACKL